MSKSFKFIILFFIIFSCSSNDILIINSNTELNSEIYSIGTAGIENKKLELDSLGYKTFYKRRNDTLFLLAKNDEPRLNEVAWIYKIKRQVSNLNCERKITIISNEISFSFCYSDVISMLEKYEKTNDAAYHPLIKAKDILENTKEKTVSDTKYFGDYLITLLVSKIPFDCNSSNKNESIKEIYINEFDFSVFNGYDNYLTNKAKDTIASLSYIKTIGVVDLWKRWDE